MRRAGFWAAGTDRFIERRGFAHGEIFAHFFQALFTQAFDGEQVVDAFEGTIGFAHEQDFFRGGGADSRDLLQFLGSGGVNVDRLERRFFCGCG